MMCNINGTLPSGKSVIGSISFPMMYCIDSNLEKMMDEEILEIV